MDLLLCHSCKVRHAVREEDRVPVEFQEFALRHRGHRLEIIPEFPDWLGYTPNANIKEAFGTNNQTFPITLTSLASAGQRGSAAIDNTSNLYLDALVQLKVKTGTISGTPIINVYAYGSADGGTDYSDGVAGTDAGVTLTVPPNLRLIGTVNTPVSATTYVGGPFSVAAAFGGTLPDHWGIVVENKTGAAFDGTVASAWWQGVYATAI